MRTLSQCISWVLIILLATISGWLGSGCANIVPPAGGPRDTIAPKIISILPKDSSLNIYPKKIEITFDKFMELGDRSQMSISPQIATAPIVEARLRKVIISFSDSAFLPNTTYTLYLGNMLQDNRENTPYPEFTYTFSTGSYFDSLSIKGFAFNAQNLNIDTNLRAALYDAATFQDSLIYRQKPLYITPVSKNGDFTFKNLPAKPFHLFVFNDANKNGVYDPGKDMMGFLSETILPGEHLDSVYVIKYYRESVDTTAFSDFNTSTRSERKSRTTSRVSGDIPYYVKVDTNSNKGSQDLHLPLTIIKSSAIKSVDASKIFLTFEKELVDVEAVFQLEENDSTVLLKSEWIPDLTYTLRLVKGWAVDTAGNEIAPGKYKFMTKRTEDYGSLTVYIPEQFRQNHLLYLTQQADSFKLVPITDSILKFEYLSPAFYSIYIIEDKNGDGVWTSGNYLQRIFPEQVYMHKSEIMVRPGWDMEETFDGTSFPRYARPQMNVGDRQGAGTRTEDR